eukprot:1184755-Prorocentrum_minimum.AAC.4
MFLQVVHAVFCHAEIPCDTPRSERWFPPSHPFVVTAAIVGVAPSNSAVACLSGWMCLTSVANAFTRSSRIYAVPCRGPGRLRVAVYSSPGSSLSHS